MMQQPLWQPSAAAIQSSEMTRFMAYINQHYQQSCQDYAALHHWSIHSPADFWQAIWDFSNIQATEPASQALQLGDSMRDARWFGGAQLNFAANLLARKDDHPAIIYQAENGDRATLSYAQLNYAVAHLAKQLCQLGISTGDRVAAFMPNRPETVIAMLATASVGAVWSSCSPDFGLQGLLDRFSQIEPSILFAVDGHFYQGKRAHHLDKIAALQQQLPSLKHTFVIGYVEATPNIDSLQQTSHYTPCFDKPEYNLNPVALPFSHPLYILYSSGTTGKPKCMVHGAGNTLIQHLKELKLHTNLTANDRLFFYTTCGWMMWNWLVSGLAVGASIVLYEGSVGYPNMNRLFDLIDEVKITHFGVGAKFLEACQKRNLIPRKTHQLDSLQCILTTGSPLLPSSFDYVYQNIKSDVQLSSISGGSDIVSCFALGNPNLPVYRGELQCIGLGMAVKVFNQAGQAVVGEKGELVCTAPFPSMPLFFWNDPDNTKYTHAYFNHYPKVWAHGDYAEITAHQGLIIYGRSDATLNPSGVRVGTAEIYQQAEQVDEVVDCLAVGQRWKNNERIILFVVLKEGVILDSALTTTIKQKIRRNTSPLHTPAKIIQVPDLPRTISGKIVEIAVKKTIHGEEINNIEALANPESLKYFSDLSELQ